ncbi:two component transcriptional regulator, winged helix family [Gloeothece citriformis PCC 7424]|uniref:Two component transcriptional regulator, winged helix family n=1 Tax=Gloeothece citriformis (strain PCC 7424) TaxID=65393 RepID=B7KBL2_GLOC7|nr:response regulator transcription factor [Gloeothece citriformis]ACK72990.1 two component transcriptional regulator, winged helix family [Gloeothece citriformis PCC 7424]
MRILLVEDDERIAKALGETLKDRQYVVDLAFDGEQGWDFIQSFSYDLIILDVMLPKLNGVDLCQRLRSAGQMTPVLMLTARDTSSDKVKGLDAGADDYVVKPFDLPELTARIRALLRRGNTALPPVLEWENLRLDPNTKEVTYAGKPLHLTPKEYGLLELFLRNSHMVLNRGQILEHLWSFEDPPSEEAVKVHIKELRKKLRSVGASPDSIETVYGLGYRLKQL